MSQATHLKAKHNHAYKISFQDLNLASLKTKRMTTTFPPNTKSRWISGLRCGESVHSVTKLMGHRTAVQVHLGNLFPCFKQESETNRFTEFNLSLMKAVCGRHLSELCLPFTINYCSPQICFGNVKGYIFHVQMSVCVLGVRVRTE